MQTDLTVPTNATANFRRSIVVAAAVGAVAVLVSSLLGHPVAGLLGCGGLALGALNSRLVQRSVVRYAASESSRRKQRFTLSVLGRLAGITVLAVALGLLVRPDGLGVFAGLAIFQLLMIGNASFPLFKELRET